MRTAPCVLREPFFFLKVLKMDVTQQLKQSARAAWAEEIERAIDNVKRSAWDKQFRREWHKADSRRRWSASRTAKWTDWRRGCSLGAAQGAASQPERVPVMPSKVWVRGHVPKEFLDWVERHWSHDNETKAMLSGCCFEEWER